MPIKTIAVLGAGTMGHGIAHAAMTAGYDTVLYDVSQAAVDKGKSAIDAVISKSVQLGKATEEDAAAMRGRLTVSTVVADAVTNADVVIEAAPEKIDLKLQLFKAVEAAAPAHAVLPPIRQPSASPRWPPCSPIPAAWAACISSIPFTA